MLTQERLKELLHYCPDTGIFTWIKPKQTTRVGDECGFINDPGYRGIGIDSRPYKSHRLAFLYMLGRLPNKQVDHINQVKSDNRGAIPRE